MKLDFLYQDRTSNFLLHNQTFWLQTSTPIAIHHPTIIVSLKAKIMNYEMARIANTHNHCYTVST